MLQYLRIQNVILVESAEIQFLSGFNVITGETGAGKSAIMAALALALGGRGDSQVIRQGAEKAVVEAGFDVHDQNKLIEVLSEAGIDHDKGEMLIIRREISANGKNRCFIDNQQAQITLLKKLGESIAEIVGQHANQDLRKVEQHRDIVDLFGDLTPELSAFQNAWANEKSLRDELNTLIKQEAQRERDIEVCSMQLEEIKEANPREGEEETLFAEYSVLSNAESLSHQADSVYQALSGDDSNALSLLTRQRQTLQSIAQLDSSLKDTSEAFSNALVELQEVAHTLRTYMGQIEFNPERAAQVDARLALLNRVKKKYGPSIDEVLAYQNSLQQKLKTLTNADARIDTLQTELQKAEAQTNEFAKKLSQARSKTAKQLSKNLIAELRTLNMPKADLRIDVTPQTRSSVGDDAVEILLAPNVGERLIPVTECASGGELSRLTLALKSVLADKAGVETLVFDEVDANIGGETASIVARKLAQIGQALQLICITHFPQVARQAHHHLQISKEERNGRTLTLVKVLSGSERDGELQRMAGGVDETRQNSKGKRQKSETQPV